MASFEPSPRSVDSRLRSERPETPALDDQGREMLRARLLEAPLPRRRPRRPLLLGAALVAAPAAVLAVALMLVFPMSPPSEPTIPPDPGNAVADAQGRGLRETVQSIDVEQPLTREAQLILTDARALASRLRIPLRGVVASN